MAYFAIILFALSSVVYKIQGKVDLKKGRIERVSFEGDQLVIVVDNIAGKKGDLQICFASLIEEFYRSCPSGFTGTLVPIIGYTKRELTFNREGQLFLGKEILWVGPVEFNKDSTLNITAAALPDARSIVTLENAEIFVPEKPKVEKVVTKKKSNASIRIVAVVVVLLLVGLILGIFMWFCVIRRTKSEQVAECDDQDGFPERRRSSTPRDLSAKMPTKRVSKITATTIQTAIVDTVDSDDFAAVIMCIPLMLFALCLAVCDVQGKVELKKGQVERVSFDGDELVISVDNSAGKKGDLEICFASLPEEAYPTCPSGFTGTGIPIIGHTKRELTLNRQGHLLLGKETLWEGPVEFNQDRSLNITATELPDASSIVILENAELFELEEPEEEKSVKKVSKGVIIGIVFGVVGLVLLLLGIGATVGSYLYRRNKNKKPVPPPAIVVQSPKIAETPNPSPAANDKKEKRPGTPKTSQPKPKSPQAPATPPPTPKAVPAPEPKPTTPPRVQPPATPPQATVPEPTPPSTKPVEPLPKKVEKAENEKKAETAKTVPTVETTEPTKDASIEPPEKPTGKQEKTKTADKTVGEKPPSPPTPKFSDHAFSRNVAANSNLREKDNLEFEETAGPLAKKIDYADIDELARFELLTESIPCYGLRNGKFSRHDNFILRERFSTRPHTVHNQEKEIMKGTPSDAVDAANVLVDRIERELRGFGYRPELGLIQKSDLWEHLDLEDTEMSKLYWLLLQMKPDLFKVEKQEVKTVEVQIMPIAMLYALILDTRLKRSFREELVTEMRTSTVEVIRLAGQDSLRLCVFPLNYLVLLYNKAPSRYIQGRKPRNE